MRVEVVVRDAVVSGVRLAVKGSPYVGPEVKKKIEEAFEEELSVYYDEDLSYFNIDWTGGDVMWGDGDWLEATVMDDDSSEPRVVESRMLSELFRLLLLAVAGRE